MKRSDISISAITLVAELSGITGLFFISYKLRSITDGIPFVQLRIPYISESQFLPFVFFGVLLWCIIFASGKLYNYTPDKPVLETVREVISRSFLWFLIYIGFVYLSTGFLFEKEIPRLIIFYVWFFSTLYSILIRLTGIGILNTLYQKNILSKKRILVIETKEENPYQLTPHPSIEYISIDASRYADIYSMIREKKVDAVLSMLGKRETKNTIEIIKLCEIYGISYAYPKILPHVYELPRQDAFIGGIPVVESISVSISGWERIIKRIFDIVISFFGIVFLSPLFLIIAILIKLEDPSGPILYKNRRVGIGKSEFYLYKFRYMYWKYSVKDAYGINEKEDNALKFEESLKQSNDTRSGPLYKIADDPRRMKIGKFLERLSLDELPQLINVLIGNMSLIGPRPHQPREVREYAERHYQVLTIKPGITGMAQVYGREKNTFEEEVALDTYYIEHYSLILDFVIFLRTILVVFTRAFTKK
ncbi:MAG: exopolysaccharide biosynthesis polyprenyl glycosylphosphotransferase [Candidatus Gracilibacteria bacterium]|nr:exopolysaccharide biosynthesis polyprenyl glycosylphosphotransferase [Candidatus Gracilibacteria bacterium]